MEGQLQREERKVIRIRTEGTGGRSEIDALHKQLEKVSNTTSSSTSSSGYCIYSSIIIMII